MTRLPAISGMNALKAFRKIGYERDHQTGSHMIVRLSRPPFRRLTIPNHRELAKGTLRSLIRAAGLTVEEFISLL